MSRLPNTARYTYSTFLHFRSDWWHEEDLRLSDRGPATETGRRTYRPSLVILRKPLFKAIREGVVHLSCWSVIQGAAQVLAYLRTRIHRIRNEVHVVEDAVRSDAACTLAGDHDILSGFPVGRCENPEICALQALHAPKDLGEGTAGGHWVGQNEADLHLGVHDDQTSQRHERALGVHGRVVQGAEGGRDDAPRIGHYGEADGVTRDVLDVREPVLMGAHTVDADGHQLAAEHLKLVVELRGAHKLRGADGREVRRVGEEDAPRTFEVPVEADLSHLGWRDDVWLHFVSRQHSVSRGFSAPPIKRTQSLKSAETKGLKDESAQKLKTSDNAYN
eukprot:scaffold4850_cov213-Pinguiococcus_pyrenoidosus.AAC.23